MKHLLTACLFLTFLACGSDADVPPPPEPAATVAVPSSTFGNLSPDEVADMMEREEVVLLDVRTEDEINEGKIESALELDYKGPDFADRISELDRNATYVVYCAAGGRSSRACELMAEAGFEKVYNMDGGFTAWQDRDSEQQDR